MPFISIDFKEQKQDKQLQQLNKLINKRDLKKYLTTKTESFAKKKCQWIVVPLECQGRHSIDVEPQRRRPYPFSPQFGFGYVEKV